MLVRVEVLTPQGVRDWSLWDGEASLSADAGVSLSTNRVLMRNGMGSTLVSFNGGGDLTSPPPSERRRPSNRSSR